MRTFFSCTIHASLMCGSMARRLNVFAQKSSHLCVMSLLGVPVRRFPPIIGSSPTCSLSGPSASSTPLVGTRSLPCASAPWGGMPGYLANPTPDTVVISRTRKVFFQRGAFLWGQVAFLSAGQLDLAAHICTHVMRRNCFLFWLNSTTLKVSSLILLLQLESVSKPSKISISATLCKLDQRRLQSPAERFHSCIICADQGGGGASTTAGLM